MNEKNLEPLKNQQIKNHDNEVSLKQQTLIEHIIELRNRLIIAFLSFLIIFGISYYFSSYIYEFLLQPLVSINVDKDHRIIYTGLTEAFFTYLKLSFFVATLITAPIFLWQIYLFMAPGLYKSEKRKLIAMFSFCPILFYIGTIFAYYFVFPYAWKFFLSFEQKNTVIPIVFEARIVEYLGLVTHIIIAFGFAFQLPIIIFLLNKIGAVSVQTLKNKRKYAIVAMFVIAAIITPPDIFSQISLAIPMILLYELAIIICSKFNKK